MYNRNEGFGEIRGKWKEGQSVKVVVDTNGNDLGYLVGGYTYIESDNEENDVFVLYTDANGKAINGFPRFFGGKSVIVKGLKVGGDEGLTG